MNLDNNILLITKEFPKIAPGGRELLNKFNHDVLSSIFAEKLKVLFLTPNTRRNLKKLFASLRCHIDGIDSEAINAMKEIFKKELKNFFHWVKGAELVDLNECDTSEDPVRPELDNKFRTSYGRKIYGVKYKDQIHAVMCFAFTNKIPKSVNDLDKLSQDAFLQSALRGQKVGQIAVAYTVWSKKKGGGKLIVKEVFKMIKQSNHLNRLVTLSPLTEMAKNFHLRNGAKLVSVNENTQNFEYK